MDVMIKVSLGFVILLLVTKLLGKTQINQLTPFHFISSLVLGEIIGNGIYEDKVTMVYISAAITLWVGLSLLVQLLPLKWKQTTSFLVGNPSIIIRNGRIDRKELRKNKLDIQQFQSLLRQNDIYTPREVEYAILEPNGSISTLKKSLYDTPNKNDLHLPPEPVNVPVTLIMDGKVVWENLQAKGFDKQWLEAQLLAKGYQLKEADKIFFADWKDGEGLYISPKHPH
nr:DUF421 domain-containing protein [Evansella caseinilytica]